MGVQVKNGQTILFIGDSITDCGRRDVTAPLGSGYVKMFADMVTIREPGKKIAIINKGIGGDRITGMRDRWSDDVLRNKPDWLSVKIGINDLVSNFAPDFQVTPAIFREAYNDILSRTKKALPRCRILLIDPFFISTDDSPSSFRKKVLDLLPSFTRVVHDMSRTYDTRLVKTHAMFQRLLRTHEPDEFCPEPVHPNPTGHLAIAEAVYDALT